MKAGVMIKGDRKISTMVEYFQNDDHHPVIPVVAEAPG